jgi:hypothetical protein
MSPSIIDDALSRLAQIRVEVERHATASWILEREADDATASWILEREADDLRQRVRLHNAKPPESRAVA